MAMSPTLRVWRGDSHHVLAALDHADLFDAIVTDPPYDLGFMGKAWDRDTIAFRPGFWAEVLRVAKPGAHLVAFGAPRTYHRLASAIEDAGWEIRDSIHWITASAMPKSRDIGKTAPEWDGWGTGLKPCHEPIVLARKPFPGTVVENVLAYGVGAVNIDATRVGTDDKLVRPPIARTDNAVLGKGLGVGVQSEPGGRWPSNLVLSHGPGCVESGTTRRVRSGPVPQPVHGVSKGITGFGDGEGRSGQWFVPGWANGDGTETIPVWACQPGCPVGEMGDVARFFPVFRYQAKASRSERPVVDGVQHPTVKPVDLMRWLIRLVTPPGGLILEPFAGSGATVEAAILEQARIVAIERDPGYLPLIDVRIARSGPTPPVAPYDTSEPVPVDPGATQPSLW